MAELMKNVCIVIPAIKKSAVIPDQLVKKLAGKTLIQRALDTAKGFAAPEDIHVVTDSEEISLICERAGVRFFFNRSYAITSLNIVRELHDVLETLARDYANLVIYRASSPLVTAPDIAEAYQRFTEDNADCLVTVKSVRQRLWKAKGNDIHTLLSEEGEEEVYTETKSLVMLRSEALAQGRSQPLKVTPYFLNDRAVEINSYQDWWICEKLLLRRHIVFVVAGYPAIGMGHIFRALMLAQEVADHRVTFVCTKESELAASSIAARDYRTKVQAGDDLAETVLALRPDLVVNDILNTGADYMRRLKEAGCRVVNFEDEGPGAAQADLVVNALYEDAASPHVLSGYRYFCLRDEFLQATRNEFQPDVRKVLVTFGGTDDSDFTRKTLDVIQPLCAEKDIALHVVAGPGYAHKQELAAHIAASGWTNVHFTAATNVMSQVMEDANLAICSAGRTVYELAHMRIPAIVLAHHEREAMHTFARPKNGFSYLGCMAAFDGPALHTAFVHLLDPDKRREMFDRMARFDFTRNKARVVRGMLALLSRARES